MINLPRNTINEILRLSGNPYATLVNKKARSALNLRKTNLNSNNKRIYGNINNNWLNLKNSNNAIQRNVAQKLFTKYGKVPTFLLKYILVPKKAMKKRSWGSVRPNNTLSKKRTF